MITVDISCVEVWRELSNYIDEAVEPALRQRMEKHFSVCKHCVAVLDGTRNIVRLVGNGHVFELPAGFAERLKVALASKLGN